MPVNSSGFGNNTEGARDRLERLRRRIRLSSLTGSYGMATVEHRAAVRIVQVLRRFLERPEVNLLGRLDRCGHRPASIL